MTPGYRATLAAIHDRGFGFAARAAAVDVTAWLAAHGAPGDVVVDLGCGSGIFAEALAARGYRVFGVDLSPEMLNLARARVPRATFVEGSVADVDVPRARAVVAVGEVFNFAFDPRASVATLATVARRVADAVGPGGLFVVDIAVPGRKGDAPRERVFDAEGARLRVFVDEEETPPRLTRRIVIEDPRTGAALDEEVHTLTLFPRHDARAALVDAGFAVEVRERYTTAALAPGWIVLWAVRKGAPPSPASGS